MEAKYISAESCREQDRYATLVRDILGNKQIQYYIETYGCQMNVKDSETIAAYAEQMGYSSASSKDNAEFLFFNTCCVRDHAEKKLMANIGALKERKDADPSLIILIGGCMMQEPGVAKKIMNRFKFVDAAIGTNVFWKLPEIIYRVLSGDRVIDVNEYDYAICENYPQLGIKRPSAFVNIMFGCDNFCSYCIVPYVRGRERSRSPLDIQNDVKRLVDSGVTEITLLGQNVNSYGKGTPVSFADLLYSINAIDGLKRIRFMTSHPKDLSDELISAMHECDKVCNHIHLPLQSGSDRILKEMNRKYDTEKYVLKVEALRAMIPDIEITTDIIVGFPGETDEDFRSTLSVVEKIGYSAAFTFKYSPRIGTKAASMPDQIPEQIKKERLAELNALQAMMTQKSNQKYIGKTGEVLVEGADERGSTVLHGRLTNNKLVYFNGDRSLLNQYCNVRINGDNKNSLMGELV